MYNYFSSSMENRYCKHFSFYVMYISLQFVDFYLCFEIFLLYHLVIDLYYMAIQLS